ncbi:hypothetical protein COU76_05355 [Candidatus Peregrinibacteria bacterium CG10_big_fil_rev_8_21_14_0_10_49_10]|nr:MAG: hypothetical protein COU76_05355 [Candidatus Peregrinibacteria bacterium CG10_big_fil_rev_8_21_14_0_10_49_10]
MPLRSHIIFSLGSLALLLAIAGQTIEHSPTLHAALLSKTSDIGVEMQAPLSLALEYTEREGSAIVRLSNGSEDSVVINLPEEWQRGEVSGASLSDVHHETTVFGLLRWHFPPHSGITFRVQHAPQHVVVHNPSRFPLKLSSTNVDLMSGIVQKDVVLVQEGTVRIW